jgi:5-dehydro-4-deoxyglucarate dehydratase
LEGTPAGPVRPPLIMPTVDELTELRRIMAAGRAVLAEALTEAV